MVFLAFIYLVGLGLFAFTKTRNDSKKFYTALLDKAKVGMAYNLDGFTKPNIANASLFDDMTQDEALDLYEKMSTNETLLILLKQLKN